MSITTSIFECPFKIAAQNLHVRSRTRGTRSPLSGRAVNTFDTGDHWAMDLSSYAMKCDFAIAIRAELEALDGRSGSVLIKSVNMSDRSAEYILERARFDSNFGFDSGFFFDNFVKKIISGSVLEDGLLNAMTAPGQNVLSLKNFGDNAQLRRGDFLSIGDINSEKYQVFRVVKDVNAVAGILSVTVRPHIRWEFAAGSVVNFKNVLFKMRLASDDQSGFMSQFGFVPTAQISLIEDGF